MMITSDMSTNRLEICEIAAPNVTMILYSPLQLRISFSTRTTRSIRSTRRNESLGTSVPSPKTMKKSVSSTSTTDSITINPSRTFQLSDQ